MSRRMVICVCDAHALRRRNRLHYWEGDPIKQIGRLPDGTYLLHMPNQVVKVDAMECLEYTEPVGFKRLDWCQMRVQYLRKKRA